MSPAKAPAEQKQKSPFDRAVDAQQAVDSRMDKLREFVCELEAAEALADGWRTKRNMEIARLRRLPDPPSTTVLAGAAHIRHTFVSRIVKGKGRPASGSAGSSGKTGTPFDQAVEA